MLKLITFTLLLLILSCSDNKEKITEESDLNSESLTLFDLVLNNPITQDSLEWIIFPLSITEEDVSKKDL